MDILVPVWPAQTAPRLAKKRPQGLGGATVALVDDNLDIAFTMQLEQLLADRHGAKVQRLVKPSGTAPSPRELIDEAAGADVAVVGVGL